jgi:hypothetical protein
MRLSLAPLLVAALLACRGSDPQPLQFLGGDDFRVWDIEPHLAGGGVSGVFAYTRPWSTDGALLRVLRHDPNAPDVLTHLGEVEFGAGTGEVFASDAIIAVVRVGGVTLVDAADPALPMTDISLASPPKLLAADARWVLAASGSTLTLVDRSAPSTRTTATAPAEVTCLLATQGSFLAFTANGYVHVVPGDVPAFVATAHAAIRGFRAGFADGAEAMVAGPATTIGRSRVARLDLSNPAAPAVLRSHDVDGEFGSFAWDGGDTSVVGIVTHTDPYWEPTVGIEEGWVVHEADGAFTSVGTPLPTWQPLPAMAAHAGYLFALSGAGFGFYRLLR